MMTVLFLAGGSSTHCPVRTDNPEKLIIGETIRS
jgi:hypothetical protein